MQQPRSDVTVDTGTILIVEDKVSSMPLHDPGGKVRLKLPTDVKSQAVFGGEHQEYRYTLHRVWDTAQPVILFVLMNPSTADTVVDDPTIAKCQRYARAWGYGAMFIGNTFAYRVTDQKQLLQVTDPVGPDNDRHLLAMAAEADLIVLAYGKPHARLRARGQAVQAMLRQQGHALHAFKLCLDGTPSHPLYLPGDLKPVRIQSS